MNIDLCLIIGIIVICVVLSYLYVKKTKEYFDNHNTDLVDTINMDTAQNVSGNNNNNNNNNNDEDDVDYSDYVKKDDLETVARASALQFCPVTPDYNPANYIKKTEIDLQQACPKMPDLKDYVLKSTIPPMQKCPSCVCPKVNVDAGLCKKCPEPKNNCPKPKPCDAEQCKNVIKCEPWQKQVSCPKCPSPQPCPQLPQKVCPAITLPKSDFKCPEPKPCPLPAPCKNGLGRCDERKDAKCNYMGIKEKSIEDIVDELLTTEDPRLQDLLEKLKNKLNLDESVSPSEIENMREDLNKLLQKQQSFNLTETKENDFEPAETMTSSSLELKSTELSNNNNNNQNQNQNQNHASDNLVPFVRMNGLPSPYDNNCLGENCPYNTDLNI